MTGRKNNNGIPADSDPRLYCEECDEEFLASDRGCAKMVKVMPGSRDKVKNVCGDCIDDARDKGYSVSGTPAEPEDI